MAQQSMPDTQRPIPTSEYPQPSTLDTQTSTLNPQASTLNDKHPPPSPKPRLLIVEDSEEIRTQLEWALSGDYEVYVADDRSTALETFERVGPEVVTLDLGLPPDAAGVTEGFHTLSTILGRDLNAKVIVMTGREERDYALKAIAEGACDFLCKPIPLDELKVILRRALHVSRLERDNHDFKWTLEGAAFEPILGKSREMQELFKTLLKVANTNAPVLIVGESGTGKELVARAIHQQSKRKDGPFVAINCSAIPETLLESELFGHEKGAFTGAHIQRKGRVESAHHGTLLLDEVGELSLALQVKLLRFLQEHRIERIGGREEIAVDARVVAATNKDLKHAMKDGRFREDLYYRIGVVTVTIPALRDRGDDILVIANVLFERFAAESGKRLKGFTRQALRALQNHRWPGNVRELENRIRRAVVMAEGTRITVQDLELSSPYEKYASRELKEARAEFERDLIQRVLAKNKGNLTWTAAELGVTRPTLYDLMQKLGIRTQQRTEI